MGVVRRGGEQSVDMDLKMVETRRQKKKKVMTHVIHNTDMQYTIQESRELA